MEVLLWSVHRSSVVFCPWKFCCNLPMEILGYSIYGSSDVLYMKVLLCSAHESFVVYGLCKFLLFSGHDSSFLLCPSELCCVLPMEVLLCFTHVVFFCNNALLCSLYWSLVCSAHEIYFLFCWRKFCPQKLCCVLSMEVMICSTHLSTVVLYQSSVMPCP